MTVPSRTRTTVYQRDPFCIVDGVTAEFGKCQSFRSLQHTVGRGAGGSKLFDTPDLLISMCCYHNVLLTSDAAFARFGKKAGWVRSRNSVNDPRLTPTLYKDGWFRLEGDGRVPVDAPTALEYMSSIGIEVF